MRYIHCTRYLLWLASCCLIFLVACGSLTPSFIGNSGATTTGTSVAAASIPIPATRTDCPAAGTGRAAVMPPLALGNHPTIVYLPEDTSGSIPPTFGRLLRYDVTDGRTTEIVKVPDAGLEPVQISADGQWILFVADTAEQQAQLRQEKLELVRLDGQYLQTLYCLPVEQNGSQALNYLQDVQWSPNQKHIIFSSIIGSSTPTVVLLDIVSGKVQTELVSTNPAVQRYAPAAWLDNRRVYVVGIPGSPSPQRLLYILDTAKGANQHSKDLQQVVNTSQYCWDFTSSVDGSKLFTAQCRVSKPTDVGIPQQQGPSRISVQPATGGKDQTIYSNQTLAVTTVRAVTSTTLLFLIHNTGGDTSQNGLWKMNTNGSSLIRLTTEKADETSYLGNILPWSSISRDGSMYALEVVTFQGKTGSSVLLFGSMNGGTPTKFADGGAIVGWTRM
jgi:Tol biopolymer transport system component